MLLITSTISPSMAAALSAKSWCNGRPAAARRNITSTIMPASTDNPADIGPLTVATSAMAATVATHGGSTFQMKRFSMV